MIRLFWSTAADLFAARDITLASIGDPDRFFEEV